MSKDDCYAHTFTPQGQMFDTFFLDRRLQILLHTFTSTHTLVITWPLGTLTASQKPLQQRTAWQPINHLRERERQREEQRHRWKGEATQTNKEKEREGERRGGRQGRERERGRWRLAHYTSPTVQAAWKNVLKTFTAFTASLQSKAETPSMWIWSGMKTACTCFYLQQRAWLRPCLSHLWVFRTWSEILRNTKEERTTEKMNVKSRTNHSLVRDVSYAVKCHRMPVARTSTAPHSNERSSMNLDVGFRPLCFMSIDFFSTEQPILPAQLWNCGFGRSGYFYTPTKCSPVTATVPQKTCCHQT